jgi:hypothetical protein
VGVGPDMGMSYGCDHGELFTIFWTSLSLHSVEGFEAQKSAAHRLKAQAKSAMETFFISGKYNSKAAVYHSENRMR